MDRDFVGAVHIFRSDILNLIITKNSGRKIVNIGCGPRSFLFDIVNVDINHPSKWIEKIKRHREKKILTEQTAKRYLEYIKNITNFIQADANNLPFKKLSFDIAILSEILEHFERPEEPLIEAQRIAKFIIICVPNEYEWSEDKTPFTHKDHKTFFNETRLKKLVDDSGLISSQLIPLRIDGWSHFLLFGFSKFYMNKDSTIISSLLEW